MITVVAELYTAVRGLGSLLALYGNTFRMAEYFVIVMTLSLIGVIVTEACACSRTIWFAGGPTSFTSDRREK